MQTLLFRTKRDRKMRNTHILANKQLIKFTNYIIRYFYKFSEEISYWRCKNLRAYLVYQDSLKLSSGLL